MLTWVKSQLLLNVWLDNMIANNLTPSTTEISKEMLAYVKWSPMRYAKHLEEKRQERLTSEQQIQKVTSKGH